MLVESVVRRLRALSASPKTGSPFGQNIHGAATLDLARDNMTGAIADPKTTPIPHCAYVIFLGSDASPPQDENGTDFNVTERIGVLIQTTHKAVYGADGADTARDLRAWLWSALVGWNPFGCDGSPFVAGRFYNVEENRAWSRWLAEFTATWGFHQALTNADPDFPNDGNDFLLVDFLWRGSDCGPAPLSPAGEPLANSCTLVTDRIGLRS